MSNEIVDSKKKSASEASVNSFGGYPIGYGVVILIFHLSTGLPQEDTHIPIIQITGESATLLFER